MRKYIPALLSVILITTGLVACNKKNDSPQKVEITQNRDKPVYELFATTNMWNFIKLNTRNGKMWQVQYSINNDESRFETTLNTKPLVSAEKETNGRFTLQPTQNIHTFILLDKINGNTWQVQWSFEEEQRMVIPIS